MGISDFGLERLKEERQKKMQKELLELQQKYAEQSARFQQQLKDESDAKRVTGTIETEDGTLRDVNVFGEQIGEDRQLSPWAQQERDMAREAHESNITLQDRTGRAQIRNTELRAQELRERRAAREAGMGGDGAVVGESSLDDIVADLLQPYSEQLKKMPANQVADFRRRARETAMKAREAKVPFAATEHMFDLEIQDWLGAAAPVGPRPTF